MTSQKWQTVWQIYCAATDIPEHERQRFLDSASVDPEVLAQVLVLLEQSEDISLPSLVPEPVPAIGSTVGRYAPFISLGQRWHGHSLFARDQDLDRTVALKFLLSNVIASGSVERLIREAKALSSLNHPNIVTVYEVIRFGSSVAIAMELIEGQALRELCGSPPSHLAGLFMWACKLPGRWPQPMDAASYTGHKTRKHLFTLGRLYKGVGFWCGSHPSDRRFDLHSVCSPVHYDMCRPSR